MKEDEKSPPTYLEKYASLLEISKRMNSEKNFDELLNLIANEAAKLLDAERVTIFMVDKAKGELWAKIALGVSDTIRFDSRLGVAGAVLMSGKKLTVEDAYKSSLFNPDIDVATGFRTRNILCSPIDNASHDTIGIFQVLNKKEGRFNSEDEQFVEALAPLAAIALENAQAITNLANRQQQLLEENQNLRNQVEERFTARTMLGTSAKVSGIRALIEKTADVPVSVLVTGENGTGKELSARALHYMSPRKKGPFIAVNCAALPETLVESELFGIERGVASGVEKRMGRIESANGGTLFLDEIGDLSLTAQAKLLRVLQEREVEWVGGRKPVPVDIRLVAATNKDLKDEITKGLFRQDLYFRLNVIHIHMPPLREIRGDLPLLAMFFVRKYAKEMGRPVETISPEAMKALTSYDWPGNIRELENQIKRAIVLSSGTQIDVDGLSDNIREEQLISSEPQGSKSNDPKSQTIKYRVTMLEIQMIRDAMTQTTSDKRRSAKMLGLSHQGLLNKLKRYGLG